MNLYQKQPNQTKSNLIQPSILKDFRCPKVLRNSCTDLYLLLLSKDEQVAYVVDSFQHLSHLGSSGVRGLKMQKHAAVHSWE